MNGELKGEVGNPQCTTIMAPKEFKVLDQTEEYYVFERKDGTIGAVEKDRVRVVTITGLIE